MTELVTKVEDFCQEYQAKDQKLESTIQEIKDKYYNPAVESKSPERIKSVMYFLPTNMQYKCMEILNKVLEENNLTFGDVSFTKYSSEELAELEGLKGKIEQEMREKYDYELEFFDNTLSPLINEENLEAINGIYFKLPSHYIRSVVFSRIREKGLLEQFEEFSAKRRAQ